MTEDRVLADLILTARAMSELRRPNRVTFGTVVAVGPPGYCSFTPAGSDAVLNSLFVVGATVSVDDRRLALWLRDQQVWVVFGDPRAGTACPDVGALNPTDRSETFEDDFAITTGGATAIDLPGTPAFSSLDFDRSMCISDFYMRVAWVTPQSAGNGARLAFGAGGGVGTFYVPLLLSNYTDDDSGIASPGDGVEVDLPGQVAFIMPGDTFAPIVNAIADSTDDGVVRVTIRYTAVEFDQEYH